MFDEYNMAYALNGLGTKAWLRLKGPFAVEGEQRTQLSSMNSDGTGATRSPLPDDNLIARLHLQTDADRHFCIANNLSGKIYRITTGNAAEDHLTDDFFLRIIVVDVNQSKTVVQDFAPAGQQR